MLSISSNHYFFMEIILALLPSLKQLIMSCAILCVDLFLNESIYIPIYNIFAVYTIIYKIIIIALELLNIAKKIIENS